jgi:tryptophanyl-tRNA synthetase
MMNFTALQDEYNCLYCVVDLHGLTVRQDPATYGQGVRRLLALYIAAGLNPDKCTLYRQSHVPAHSQLSWLLNCYTYVGELNRMTQFKDKSQRHEDNVNAGLFDYPVLMAADVLLFNAHLVPIGADQKQHMELTRNIAIRFNNIYGDVFVVPDVLIRETGARIKKLQDPEHTMSKSEVQNLNNTIFLLDEPDVIMSKFKKAVTDSDSAVRYAPEEKPGVSNLLTIYSCLTGESIEQSEKTFEGKGYGTFKQSVGEACVTALSPIQAEYKRLIADPGYIDGIIKQGAGRAAAIAEKTMQKVHEAIGLN